MERMRADGLNLGGEQSGHIIMADYSTTGDGLVAALQVLAVLAEHRRPASEACRLFTRLPQRLRSVRFAGGSPLADSRVKQAVADAERALADTGRLLLRASGTEPVIRVMAEGEDEALVSRIVDSLCATISDVTQARAAPHGKRRMIGTRPGHRRVGLRAGEPASRRTSRPRWPWAPMPAPR